jgi:hypothetical protein
VLGSSEVRWIPPCSRGPKLWPGSGRRVDEESPVLARPDARVLLVNLPDAFRGGSAAPRSDIERCCREYPAMRTRERGEGDHQSPHWGSQFVRRTCSRASEFENGGSNESEKVSRETKGGSLPRVRSRIGVGATRAFTRRWRRGGKRRRKDVLRRAARERETEREKGTTTGLVIGYSTSLLNTAKLYLTVVGVNERG